MQIFVAEKVPALRLSCCTVADRSVRVSNYGRNIDVLARSYRVIVPRHARYGSRAKPWVFRNHSDPFGLPGRLDSRPARRIGRADSEHLVGTPMAGPRHCGSAGHPTPGRQAVLMVPGGIGTTRGLPTDGLKALLSYYGDDGPSRAKLASFIRTYLVYDGAAVPDDLIDLRYQASLDPEWWPTHRCNARRVAHAVAGWTSPWTSETAHACEPHSGAVGRDDKVNRPSGGPMLLTSCPTPNSS